ncbi:MAG: FtsX-like permease family protein [Oscillospiraceae bacterium]|jgi:putative ABC transport system permease protein|nr:FtsX-like permease family protein [Oscillospiraceae bacterium]
MYVIHNAIKNLGRNKGRNSLMGIILLVIIVATAVSILIGTTSAAIIKDYKGRFGSEVFLYLDYAKAVSEGKYTEYEGSKGVDSVSPAKYLEYAKSQYLQKTALSCNTMVEYPGLKVFDDEEGWDLRGRLFGSNSPNISAEFASGIRKLIDGEFYRDGQDECIISKDFADLNGLKVGDTITVKPNKTEYKLKIVGIFKDDTLLAEGNANAHMSKNPVTHRHNEVLTDMETAEKIGGIGAVTATYYLKDPSMLQAFTDELYANGLPNYYAVQTDEAGYNAVVGPVENMAKITNTFMIVVLILGGVILLIISTMAIRERKYEIGVLRAMGMKKGKVAVGFVSEMLALTVLCLIVGFAASVAVSQPVADTMLSGQIKIAEQAQNSGLKGAYTTTASTEPNAAPKDLTPLSELNVRLGADAAVRIALVALLLAMVSSVIGIVFITRYEPMQILSERN